MLDRYGRALGEHLDEWRERVDGDRLGDDALLRAASSERTVFPGRQRRGFPPGLPMAYPRAVDERAVDVRDREYVSRDEFERDLAKALGLPAPSPSFVLPTLLSLQALEGKLQLPAALSALPPSDTNSPSQFVRLVADHCQFHSDPASPPPAAHAPAPGPRRFAMKEQSVQVPFVDTSAEPPWIIGDDIPDARYHCILPHVRWVIRDDDLKLAATVWATAGSMATLLASRSGSHAPAVLSIAGSLWAMGTSILKKGVVLDPLRFKVLATLKTVGPCTSAALADLVDLGSAGALSPAAVEAELESLTKVRLKDGTVVPLVAKDADGNWGTAGV